ncbi:acyl-CoA carboxylase subunit beta [Saccharopolyspora shandongensis]|uniref:acyl-CoA carboxylase subunit beta n=1 Tax=Saccharopolyspora shandongensis TaxID=418495 RepID=UPI0033F17EBC
MTATAAPRLITERAPDPRLPVTRLARLLDRDSATALHPPDDCGVTAVAGRIDGARVISYCTDATKMGGALGADGARRIVDAIDRAVRDRCPVVGLWHSGGAKLAEGVESMDGVGQMFAAMIRASGQVPQISVVLGPAAGAAAYGPALTDVVIMAADGRLFVTGPDVVRSVTGEQVDMAGLGGPAAHGQKSGVAHVLADSEPDAYDRARRITGLLAQQGAFDLRAVAERKDLRALLPDAANRAYDVHPLVREILDSASGFDELQQKWAPNVVTGLGRLGGRTVGVVANNPLRKGGCLDSLSAEKAARFVRMCDSFGVQLLVIVDVPGYLPGVNQEWAGVVRRGAKLLYAFAESVVPRVTLVTRKAYGGAYIAMNSRALGASAVFAWPEAEVAVMGTEAAVGILHRKRLSAVDDEEMRLALRAELVDEHERLAGGVGRALDIGVVDEVIDPADTRRRVAAALAEAAAGRGHHGNIPL